MTGFPDVDAIEGNQFFVFNALEARTLDRDQANIAQEAVIEFSFAHRGRNSDDTLKLTITDPGADKS